MKIKSNATYVFRIGGENLLPGINYVSNKSIVNHPGFKVREDKGVLEVMDKQSVAFKKGDNTKSTLAKLSKLNAKNLIKEIPQIYDYALLEVFKIDARSTVSQAAAKQLKKLSNDEHTTN